MTSVVLGLWALILIAVALRWPERLLAAAIISCVFEGVALVNAGGIGISPYYFTLMLIAVRCVAIRLEPGRLLGHTARNRSVIVFVGLLVIVAIGGALALPKVFAGIPVMSPRLSADATAPLEFSTSNLGQSIYLLLNAGLLWYVAQQKNDPTNVRHVGRAVVIAGAIVVGLGLYQLASALSGLPFPDDILYSNDGFVMQHGTAILDMPRICSTFTEPAGLAVFLIGFIAFLTSPSAGEFCPLRWRAVLLPAAVGVALLSTSSTAYIGLAGVAALRLFTHVVMPAFQPGGSFTRVIVTLLLMAVAASVVLENGTLRDLINTTVLQKDESDSYQERSDVDSHAMELSVSTFGLGVGLGSNRASGFFPSAISTIGIYGVALLAIVVCLLLRFPETPETRGAHHALAVFLVAIIGTKLISSPDLATPSMWAAMAALIAVHGHGAGVPRERVDLMMTRRVATLKPA